MPTVKEIVTEYLKANGYDGIYSDDGECGCLAGDLMPCDYLAEDCCAGYRVPCPENCGEHDWHIAGIVHIGPKRPDTEDDGYPD